MKTTIKLFIISLFFVQAGTNGFAQENKSAEQFLGKWSLFLPGGAGWLEVRQEDGYLDADLLWYGGSVTPVSSVFILGDKLIVTRTRQVKREGNGDGGPRMQTYTTWIEMGLYSNQLAGTYTQPMTDGSGVRVTKFRGVRLPPLPEAPDLSKINYGNPVILFNGKDLSGWTLTDPTAVNGWTVKDGVLHNNPVQDHNKPHIRYGNLRTVDQFEDFNLKVQVNIPKGSNSGIYLRGIYEVQVLDSYGKPLDSHNMGALYSRITPSVSAEKPAGSWQDLDITLYDRYLTVKLNGTIIIDNKPVEGVTGGALTADEFSPGPIYLQGDHGVVSYRNLVLTPIIH